MHVKLKNPVYASVRISDPVSATCERLAVQPARACGITLALIPNWFSFAFAPAMPLDRLMVKQRPYLRASAQSWSPRGEARRDARLTRRVDRGYWVR